MEKKGRSQSGAIWFRFQKNKLALISLVILGAIVLAALFANVLIDPELVTTTNSSLRLQTPSAEHWFGTDLYGRDVLARIVYGARVSLTVSVTAVFGALIVGGLLGAVAAYFGGHVENIIMRIMDIFMAIPSLVMAIAVVAALGASTVNLVVALIVARAPQFARVVRSAILPIRDLEYVEAATACGTSHRRIILRHILPNVLGPIIVQTTLQMGHCIIQIAGLSFVGLGIQPPTPEWGSMLSEAREYMRRYSFLVVPPGLAIMITVFCFNRIGDGLRDALDPKLKN
ncbi:MAG: ABC transporter permease [Oscillospiraceae bacterium]|nr:ABC transporter permease [Oscillospiraceae bacterium]MBR3474783.1 ABC transporter permease [Oscillospiraceae bacterium]